MAYHCIGVHPHQLLMVAGQGCGQAREALAGLKRLAETPLRPHRVIVDMRGLMNWPSSREALVLLSQLAALLTVSSQIALVMTGEQMMNYASIDWTALSISCCLSLEDALQAVGCPPSGCPSYQVNESARAMLAKLASP